MIVPLTEGLLKTVLANIRPCDYDELRYSSFNGEFSAKQQIEMVMGSEGPKYACVDNTGEPVAVGGINPQGSFSIGWAYGTSRFTEKAIEITRQSRKLCVQTAKTEPVCALSWDKHPGSQFWLERIGFEPARRFRINEEPFTLYDFAR